MNKLKHILGILLIFLTSCSTTDNTMPVEIGPLPESDVAFQQMLLRQLTGEEAIKTATGEDIYLNSRWDTHERLVVRSYFKALFDKFDLPFHTHPYELKNSNVAVDLLIEPLKGTNFYTILPATVESDEYVIFGAHYDTDGHNFPGAIDNGSGLAVITSVLRQAMGLAHRSKNLMVVYFDQEEENISAGSIAFARHLNTQAYKLHSVHSYDLIGWDADNNKEISLAFPSPEIEHLYRQHADSLDIPLYSTQVQSSDYYSFIKEGINAVGISQAYGKGDISGKKDSPEDKFHLVNFAYLESSTRLAFAALTDMLHD